MMCGSRAPLVLGLVILLLVAACGAAAPASRIGGQANASRDERLPDVRPVDLATGQKLRIVATTDVVGDVIRNVAGDQVELTTLVGPGQDPHTYQPTPKDIAAIERAHLVFLNGFALEEGLESTVDAAAGQDKPVVSVSAGIRPRQRSSGAEGQDHAAGDPHVWFDPANVKVWTDNIATVLSALDPAHADAYQASAATYERELDELDATIRSQVALIPEERRRLVTDHEALGYFADRYGFRVVGAVIPSLSTSAEPSAGDLATLVEVIRAQGVSAVFVGVTTSPKLADLVARETGAQVLPLYTGELGPAGSGAETYLGMMRVNLDTIVKGLTGGQLWR